MKNLLLISFLLIAGTAKSQWIQQFSDEYHYYNTMFFVDSLNGWIGGYTYTGDKFIVKTTNGGVDWDLNSIASIPSSINFINDSTGFCATFDGIYETKDGGSKWSLIYQDSLHYNSIQFIDENIGWATGYNLYDSYLIKTENGGVTWNKYLVAKGIREPKMEMINKLTGFIVSLDKNNIWKTSDGGETWSVVNNNPYKNQLWNLSFSDQNTGFICGINNFLYTNDGGDTWEQKFIPITFCSNIHSRGNDIWVAGFGINYSAIVYSDDSGNTWTPIFVDDSTGINDFFFSDVNTGWYCSSEIPFNPPLYNGFIYKIKRGWTEEIVPPSTPKQIYPENDSFLEENVFNFEWEKLDYSLYRLQISCDSLFTNFFVITNQSTGDTTFSGNNLYIENNPLIGLFPNKKYYWRIRSENKAGISEWSETWSFTIISPNEVKEENFPTEFKLFQNYPNPFNPTTKISYSIPKMSFVTIEVYDVLGNKIETLVNKYKTVGTHNVEFNGSNLASGIYFYNMQTGDFIETKKMILMK